MLIAQSIKKISGKFLMRMKVSLFKQLDRSQIWRDVRLKSFNQSEGNKSYKWPIKGLETVKSKKPNWRTEEKEGSIAFGCQIYEGIRYF